jgi:hypothetical protein
VSVGVVAHADPRALGPVVRRRHAVHPAGVPAGHVVPEQPGDVVAWRAAAAASERSRMPETVRPARKDQSGHGRDDCGDLHEGTPADGLHPQHRGDIRGASDHLHLDW